MELLILRTLQARNQVDLIALEVNKLGHQNKINIFSCNM